MFLFYTFILTFLIANIALFLFPKTLRILNSVSSVVCNCLFIIVVWIIAAGLLNFVNVKINLISFSVVNIVMSISCGIYIIIKKSTQKYFTDWYDVAVVIGIFILAIAIGMHRYGSDLRIFAYESDDAARHLEELKHIIYDGRITVGRYAMYIPDAVIGLSILNWMSDFNVYKALEIGDILLLALAGCTFFSWVRRFAKNRIDYFISIIISLIYMLGFPLTNMLHGFEYLGMGVLLINHLIIVIQDAEDGYLSFNMEILAVLLLNASICFSYTLFAPAIFLAELVFYFIKLRNTQRIISWYSIKILLGIFLTPVVLCVLTIAPQLIGRFGKYIIVLGIGFVVLVGQFIGLMKLQAAKRKISLDDNIRSLESFLYTNKKQRLIFDVIIVVISLVLIYFLAYRTLLLRFLASGVMSKDGSIYRNTFADFILYFIFIIVYVGECIKEKKNDFILWLLCIMLGYSAWIMRYSLLGVIGSYYFYKMQFVLSLLVFGITFITIVRSTGGQLKVLRIQLGLIIIGIIIAFWGIEGDLKKANYYLWPKEITSDLFGVYVYNQECLENGGNLCIDDMIAFEQIYEYAKDVWFIPVFGDEIAYYKDYYYILTGQNRWLHPHWLYDENCYTEDVERVLRYNGYTYVFVLNDYDDGLYAEQFSKLTPVWECQKGILYRAIW